MLPEKSDHRKPAKSVVSTRGESLPEWLIEQTFDENDGQGRSA
jgi:hypothetical protein